jgi:hypothetical protein
LTKLTRCGLIALTAAILAARTVRADVSEYISGPAWQAAVGGNFSSVDFTGLPLGQFVGDAYASQGLRFDFCVAIQSSTWSPNDSRGFLTSVGIVHFDTLQTHVAVEHYGPVRMGLYYQGQHLHTSSISFFPGPGNFSGLVSTVAFDEVRITQPSFDQQHALVDDLHWGTTIQPKCPSDTDGDGWTDIDDLLTVINSWGTCPQPCPSPCAADVTANCLVNIDDLLAVINGWGPCR